MRLLIALAPLLLVASAAPESPPAPHLEETLLEAFDVGRALEDAAYLDGARRAPGGPGYRRAADHVVAALTAAGFGERPGLRLDVVRNELDGDGWSGGSASVALVDGDGGTRVLHAFASPGDVERAVLPRNAPAANVEGYAVFELEDVHPGTILVTEARLRRDLVRRAGARGAVAVVSAALAPFNRGDDAIQLRELAPGFELPVFQISPRSFDEIALSRAPRLRLRADVAFLADATARTIVATVEGLDRSHESVVTSARLQGGAASDDAAGAAAVLEMARTAAALVDGGAVPRPSRSLTFVFGPTAVGPESLSAPVWAVGGSLPVAAVGVLGIGTGELVLERAPGPGSAAAEVPVDGLVGLARLAAGRAARLLATPEPREQDWEGGSSLDALADAGVPTVLFWGAPGPVSRTSLDRAERIDPLRLRAGALAALTTAWSVAHPDPDTFARAAGRLEGLQALDAPTGGVATDPARRARWLASARSWLRETL